uniref:Uncharacterized protein n=1 Tax=Denticeps clupeoides TaxID=299321 RepID=A0AAY4B148_9TELE
MTYGTLSINSVCCQNLDEEPQTEEGQTENNPVQQRIFQYVTGEKGRNRHRAEVKRQERELLEARSLPLRNYLMKYVMPTLSQGMSECCKENRCDCCGIGMLTIKNKL